MSLLSSTSWRASILQHFGQECANIGGVSAISDPDGLLTDPSITESIRANGFVLIVLEDPVVFRFLYESQFRQVWEHGENKPCVVVVRGQQDKLNTLPYDILEKAQTHSRIFSFSVVELFPELAPGVVAELSHQHLDKLWQATQKLSPRRMGVHGTCDFVLRHVFDVNVEQIQTAADLLCVLLRRHHRSQHVPDSLNEHLLKSLIQRQEWRDWPLERIIPSQESFLLFLQERWPYFLIAQGYPVIPGREPTVPSIAGPVVLPFEHEEVRSYVAEFFAKGLLVPTTSISVRGEQGTWICLGVVGESGEDGNIRLARLLPVLENNMPSTDAEHHAWLDWASRWAEVMYLRWQNNTTISSEIQEKMVRIHEQMEEKFATWILHRYGNLYSLPYLPTPVTVDKISRYLAYYRRRSGEKKLALLVFDGLALDQWLVLREAITDYVCEESLLFSYVPTLTSISRQAIFAGEAPWFFAESLGTTQKEAKHWSRFWDNQGINQPAAVMYLCQKKDESDIDLLARIKEMTEQPSCEVIGIVVGVIDRMLHGTVTGMGGMHASVRYWASQGHFRLLLQQLWSQGFEVFLTADHGNIEATGMGKPSVGEIAYERGERVHVFSQELLRSNVHKQYPDTHIWPNYGLPGDYLPLFPRGSKAFLRVGASTLGHGGISLEEVIVPLVRISERT